MVAYASRVTEDAVKRPIRFENGGFFPPMLTSSNYPLNPQPKRPATGSACPSFSYRAQEKSWAKTKNLEKEGKR